jgi:hypothetical protein
MLKFSSTHALCFTFFRTIHSLYNLHHLLTPRPRPRAPPFPHRSHIIHTKIISKTMKLPIGKPMLNPRLNSVHVVFVVTLFFHETMEKESACDSFFRVTLGKSTSTKKMIHER